MGTSRPSIHYNSVNNRWEVRRKGGDVIVAFHNDGRVIAFKGLHSDGVVSTLGALTTASLATLTTAKVGAGTELSQVYHVLGSPATLNAIGTLPSIGSIPATGVIANDIVFANPRVAPPVGLFIGSFRVSGTNNVYFKVANTDNAVTGSLVGAGWDVFAVRKA